MIHHRMKNLKLSTKDAAIYSTIFFFVVSLLLAIVLYFGRAAFVPSGERPHVERDFNLWVTLIITIGSYIYFFTLFAVNFKILESKLKERIKIFVVIACSLTTALFFNTIISLLMQFVSNIKDVPPGGRIGPLVKDFVLATGVLFLSIIVYLSSQKQRLAIEYETLKAENERSRFEVLKNQLDPHFLFNTFNSLDSLIEENSDMARNYLQQLSSVFRYVLSNKDSTTLESELKFTHSYIDLMQLRYENSLIFEISIDNQYLSYEIVPLSIQLLIENAIKHNVITLETPLIISVSVGPEPFVTVSNKIQLKKSHQSGSGIGLSNLAERFRLKYQKEIEISNNSGQFSVTLPLHYPVNNSKQLM